MAKFRKKPIVIEAYRCKNKTFVQTMEGQLFARAGDWIVTGVKGEKYPVADEIFRLTYEPADVDAERLWLGED